MDMVTIVGASVAFVLLAAGATKWRSAAATAATMQDFGIPPALAGRLAPALPWAETGIGGLLLLPGVGWYGALLAALLALTLTGFIGGSLLAGRRPQCNCFGQAGSAPLSWATFARSALLSAGAAWLVLAGPARFTQGIAVELGGFAVAGGAWALAAALIGIQMWLLLKLAVQQGRLLLKIDNLEYRLDASGIATSEQLAPAAAIGSGALAPEFSATTLSGQPTSLRDLRQGGAGVLLVFVRPDCAPCKEVVTALSAGAGGAAGGEQLVFVSTGKAEANAAKFGAAGGAVVLLQQDDEIGSLFGVAATPSAVRIQADGRIAAPLAVGRDQILGLAGNQDNSVQLRRPHVAFP